MSELLSLIGKGRWKDLFFAPTQNGWIQLFRYCFVGGTAFLIDFGLYCFFQWIGLHYLLAGALAFIIAFIYNFLISRRLIFKATATETPKAKELIVVLLISLTGLGLTEALLYCGTDLIHLDYAAFGHC